MYWQGLVKNLLDQLKVDDAIENSFKNFHAPGVDYLNLLRTEQLTVKIYMIPDTVQFENKCHDVLVNPHSHAYNFHTILLEGGLDNVVFNYAPNSWQPNGAKRINNNFTTHNHFSYVSPHKSKDKSGFKYLDSGHLTVEYVEELRKKGDSYYMPHNGIHSIRPIRDTTLLLLQYNDVDKDNTEFFTQDENPPVTDKLYQKFNESEVVNIMNKIDYLCTAK